MSRLWIIILIAIFITVATTAYAQEIWTKSTMKNDPDFTEFYSAIIPNGNCTVYVKRNNMGVMVFAIYFDKDDKSVFHKIDITGKNQIHYIRTAQPITKADGSRKVDIREGDGFYVFNVKCMGIARQLPPEIRKKFFGCYDING